MKTIRPKCSARFAGRRRQVSSLKKLQMFSDPPGSAQVLGSPDTSLAIHRIEAIEFIRYVRHVYKGEGGYNSDHEFFNTMADI